MKQYIVIGGGIAGLSAAYYLYRRAEKTQEPIQVTVLEKEPMWGGKIRTERIDGFIIEGGPDTFLASKPWAVQLCQELGISGSLFGTNPHQKHTYVIHKDQLKPLPDGLTMMIPTRLTPMVRSPLLNWAEKARMGLDFFIPPQANGHDESLGAFISRRLGRAAYENLIEPLMSGIYAGDGDRLSLQATFPYLHDLEREYGGLVRGALAVRRKMNHARKNGGRQENAPSSRSIFLTPQTGLAEIVEALVEWLEQAGADLRPACQAKAIEVQPGEYRITLEDSSLLTATGVILAAPAYASGDLLRQLDPELSHLLLEIPYASTATVTLAYAQHDVQRELDGYGYVIPRRAGRQALACTWTSTKFPHRAPPGMVLLRVFIGRAGQEADLPWEDSALEDIARRELADTLGIHAQPQLSRVFRWENAMPQYNLGHPARLQAIEARLAAHPGLALAGNGYRGIGIPDCIHSGEIAASQVLESALMSAVQPI
jgi:oxygen-dependent protoporphyrinogen oxidase